MFPLFHAKNHCRIVLTSTAHFNYHRKISLEKVDLQTLLSLNKLILEKISITKPDVKAAIFKDMTKPMDSSRFPVYLGQTIRGIKMPLRINKIKAKKVELENTERKPDSTLAVVKINKAKLEADNITNLAPKENLACECLHQWRSSILCYPCFQLFETTIQF